MKKYFGDFNNLDLLIECYLTNLNKNNIEIEKEDFFLSQLKYEKVPIVGENLARFLFIISYLFNPSKILEIGYGSGYSSFSIYSGIMFRRKTDDSSKDYFIRDIEFISLERNGDRYDRGVKFIKSKNMNIKLFYEDFNEWYDFFKQKDYFDFIFVDSVKKNYIDQLSKTVSLLKKGGILIFDNVFFDGKVVKLNKNNIPKYCDTSNKLNYFNHLISKRKDLYVNFIKIDDGIVLCVKK
ncbi:MAG: hypothetical protein N3A58_04210 [Spirochaetes bacterium]|nr:hypothetical protein [Spirochaetota bacterium]